MEITLESKEQIKAAKQKQKDVIHECDRAIADIQTNIQVLQKVLANQKATKKQAQNILDKLSRDFPDVASEVK